ncbi:kinesin-related protein 4-like isoform X2 [Vespa crabro]|uniref:kinesin-related protein 4-like isoform X2 n=1 Tax=Vespa crabro TaxID=7445 RepID=UPI001F011952|nr:kinesin-related protein 4-like isoform X2 [Vespa crabro]XP_046817304.1 kinesin-related protein 4-like isoform X2 [Vespa crabro]
MANIKVAVRVRPFSARELKNSRSTVVICTDQNGISLTNLKVPLNKAGDSRERTRKYDFDYCFDSTDPESENYANQEKIYDTLGKSVLNDIFAGYNSCLLTYGQSASGKTYTIMGTENDPGLTPRLCKGIFARIREEKLKENIFHVSISYLEIYNERVRDLLKPSSSSHSLRVREHPRLGPYVQGLTYHVANTLETLMSYVEGGTKARKTAATLQNSSSSRSHALLTIFLNPEISTTIATTGQQSTNDENTDRKYNDGASSSKRNDVTSRNNGSKLHLVDLAGSENAQRCDGLHRLKEGANINKSLVALGNVISALTGKVSGASGSSRRYIPYRDSSLTWLLKDALGGNATTVMFATVSPASENYNETAHTLRFAQRAHSVVNKPVVNEDPMAKTIRELRAEITRLKSLLLEKNIEPDKKSVQNESETNDSEKKKDQSSKNSVLGNKRQIEHIKEGVSSVGDSSNSGVLSLIRRVNSTENLTNHDNASVKSIRKFGSYECLDYKTSTITSYSYNRAEVSELKDEENNFIGEINEAVFVDIPTLVAVLIKPDNNFHENSTQIEEICSDEIHDYPIESDFIGSSNLREICESRTSKAANNDYENENNHFNLDLDNEINDTRSNIIHLGKKEKSKFCKQDSINVATPTETSTNLYMSRKFGSVEILQKKRDNLATLERSNTNLEKQTTVPEEVDIENKLVDKGKVENSKSDSYTSLWKDTNKFDSRDYLQRTGSNEFDKNPKDNSSVIGLIGKIKNTARKPSLESLKRKTSKDSSSSSSKDEQILISSLTNDKILKRKDSLDHNPSTRVHTPVQKTKRAEIVAAVTERLYSSRKQVEEMTGVTGSASTSLSGIRSPPEGTDVRLMTSSLTAKTKLQEISRKMLAKRRRVNVDTQTEQIQTIRMKDSASLTDETKIVCQDVGVLTDEHNGYQMNMDNRSPVIRVKEIATLTDKLKYKVMESKDAECLVNDLNFYEYGVNILNNNSKILLDDMRTYTNKMSNTDTSELCLANDKKVNRFDKSTNTVTVPVAVNSIIQTQQPPEQSIVQEKTTQYFEKNYNVIEESILTTAVQKSDRNVISMCLPDTISITIESSNLLESKVVIIDDTLNKTSISEKRDLSRLKDNECQTETEKKNIKEEDMSNDCYVKEFATKSSVSQTDNKCFRIENIFEDPRHISKICTQSEEDTLNTSKNTTTKASVTFTNSLGTSFVPDTKESATDMNKGQVYALQSGRSFNRDKSFRETFISKKYNNPLATDIWKNWMISFPPTSWQRPRNVLSVNGLTFAWNNSLNNDCTAIVSTKDLKEPNLNSNVFLPNNMYDNNEVTDLKSPSLIARIDSKRLLEHDYNFSDDSLDYNEENVICNSNNINTETPKENEIFENICPPDVVAHTKKENSTTLGNSCDNNVEVSLANHFEKDQIEFPKKKSVESIDESFISAHNYKSLILGKDTINIDNSQEARINFEEKSSNTLKNSCKKKVTFMDSKTSTEHQIKPRETNSLNQSKTFSKPFIKKKIHEHNANDNDSQVVYMDDRELLINKDKISDDHLENINNNEGDNIKDKMQSSAQEKKTTANFIKISSNKSIKSYEKNSFRNSWSDSDSSEDINRDEDCIIKLKRKILQEYVNEATTFMRNMNSFNEYINNTTNICEKHQKQEKKRGNHRRNYPQRNENNTELKSHKVIDNNIELLEETDVIVATESFKKCLESIERLENCIEKTNKHNEYLREKYGIVVESAGAKSGLASSSIDSSINSKISSNPVRKDTNLQEEPIISETLENLLPSNRCSLKDSSMPRFTEDPYDPLRIYDDFYDTNNEEVFNVKSKIEKKHSNRLINVYPSCHCRTKSIFYRKEKQFQNSTCKFYHFYDDRNMNDFLDDSVAKEDENIELSSSILMKPIRYYEHLGKSFEDNGFPRLMTNTFLRCTKNETLNFANSRIFHRATVTDSKPYSWERWRYRPESPRAKFLELLHERRRIVENSRDVTF